MKSFLIELKNEWKKALIGFIVVLGITQWENIYNTFDTGSQIKATYEFNSNMIKALKTDSVKDIAINNLMSDPDFVRKILDHPEVQKYVDEVGKGLRNEIVENVIKNDSNKVSMRSFVGREADIRDEQVLPLIAEIVKAWKEGKITKTEDIHKIIRKEIKPTALKRPIAQF